MCDFANGAAEFVQEIFAGAGYKNNQNREVFEHGNFYRFGCGDRDTFS